MLKNYKPVDSLAWQDDNNDKLKLDWNESNSFLPSIGQKIFEFLESSNISYYPNLDNEIILEKLSLYTSVNIGNIELTASSDYGHEIVLKYIANRKSNARCLIVTPTYDNFRSTSQTILDDVVLIDCGIDGYKDVLKYDFNGFDLVYLSNPNNPTTDYLNLTSLKEALIENKETLFLIDEAYIDFDLERSAKDLILEYRNIIISRTFSKAFGLAAFRVGYLLCQDDLCLELSRFNNVKYVNAFAKIAVEESLMNLEFLHKNICQMNSNKRELCQILEGREDIVRVISGGGNFLLIECTSPIKVWEGLRSKSVYVRSLGHLKGMDSYLRVTVPVNGIDYLKRQL